MNIKVSGKKILAGVGILLLLGLTAGCSASEKISWERLAQTHEDLVFGRNLRSDEAANTSTAATVVEEEQADLAQDTVDRTGIKAEQKEKTAPKAPAKVKVTLYFANADGELVAEERTLAGVTGVARATIVEMIKGPQDKKLSRTIPDGTRLIDIDVHDGLATVNFSREFVDNHGGGSSGELVTVYSVVDTLAQYPTVKKVQFLVEGQRVETLAGHMDLANPVERNTDIIKEK